MKKLFLIAVVLIVSLQTFSFVHISVPEKNITYVLPANLKAMALQEFLNLTPKKYRELTGKKMTFKEKLVFTILKAKLKRQLPDEKPTAHKTDLGLLSLVFGGAAFLFALIPYVGIVSIPLAIAAVVLGILGLGRKKGDTKSIIGLVLGGVLILLVAVAIAAFPYW